ncbi:MULTISPECIES: diacylglycerol kinase family protein [Vagococcus]|nr:MULTISPECIES: diacylglycerol kinase family protein [Vagococcus]
MDLKDNKQIRKNKSFFESLRHATNGLVTVLKEERNMKYHISLMIIVIFLSFLFHLSNIEWLFILVAIFLVLITETINTAFETIVDLVTDKSYHILAKKIKDMAAGAVLLSAVLACLIGIVIFIPKIWQMII